MNQGFKSILEIPLFSETQTWGYRARCKWAFYFTIIIQMPTVVRVRWVLKKKKCFLLPSFKTNHFTGKTPKFTGETIRMPNYGRFPLVIYILVLELCGILQISSYITPNSHTSIIVCDETTTLSDWSMNTEGGHFWSLDIWFYQLTLNTSLTFFFPSNQTSSPSAKMHWFTHPLRKQWAIFLTLILRKPLIALSDFFLCFCFLFRQLNCSPSMIPANYF